LTLISDKLTLGENLIGGRPTERRTVGYFFLYPAGQIGLIPVTCFVSFPFIQVILMLTFFAGDFVKGEITGL